MICIQFVREPYRGTPLLPLRCADEISFNGYPLLSTNLSPLERVLEVGNQRHFFNLQLQGERARAQAFFFCVCVCVFIVCITPWTTANGRTASWLPVGVAGNLMEQNEDRANLVAPVPLNTSTFAVSANKHVSPRRDNDLP